MINNFFIDSKAIYKLCYENKEIQNVNDLLKSIIVYDLLPQDLNDRRIFYDTWKETLEELDYESKQIILYNLKIYFESLFKKTSFITREYEKTITKQEKVYTEKGITIVACFNNDSKKYIKNQIIDKLNSLNYKFVSFEKNLHCTFLTLFEVGNSISDPHMEDTIIKYIKKYFTENNLFRKINFTLKFNCIRPGTSNKLESEHKSDGTVIIYGNYQDNTDFITCAELLAKELKSNFPTIFLKNYNRIAPTVWSTVGYFQEDFEMTEDIEVIFNQWRNLYKVDSTISSIRIKELKILKTATKSLDSSNNILTI